MATIPIPFLLAEPSRIDKKQLTQFGMETEDNFGLDPSSLLKNTRETM